MKTPAPSGNTPETCKAATGGKESEPGPIADVWRTAKSAADAFGEEVNSRRVARAIDANTAQLARIAEQLETANLMNYVDWASGVGYERLVKQRLAEVAGAAE